MSTALDGYNIGYLDEQTKRMIRRALLKAVAIPGFQVPFASREVPMPRGWGTGGVQVTASIIGQEDVLKVIDQGADDTTNAVSIRSFFAAVTGVAATTRTDEATIIQTRHRIPETPLAAGQTIVYQVPGPEPLRFLEPRETETRRLHALADYGLMYVKLYEDIAKYGHIATTYDYPVMVAGRYLMSPSPIPSFDNPKMHRSPALQLFGAGREKRIYAVPPFTDVESLGFEDHPFEPQRFDQPCAICGSAGVYLDEVITDDKGGSMFVCSDTDHCERAAAASTRLWRRQRRGGNRMNDAQPLLEVRGAGHRYGDRYGCRDVDLDLWPGEVLAVVGESGSGKTTLLGTLSQRLSLTEGSIRYRLADGTAADLAELSEAAVRRLWRTEWGFVHQNPADGLRMHVSAGGNVGEPLMATGWRHYGRVRAAAADWLRAGGDPRRPHRRPARHVLRRHAAAPADRQEPRGLAAPGVHGRADKRAGRVGAGAPARPDPLARGRARPRRHHRDARPGGGAAHLAPHPGHEGRPRHRVRPHRPGARRPAGRLHPAPRLLDPARMIRP